MSTSAITRFVNAPGHLPADFPFTPAASGKLYLKSLLCYLVGTLLPIGVFMAFCQYAVTYDLPLADALFAPDHFMLVMAVVSTITFLSGFGAQFLFVRRAIQRQNSTVSDVLSLNLKNYKGSKDMLWGWGMLTFFVAAVLEQVVAALLPFKITDSTAEIINGMHGLSFALMALLAVFAPVLEEIIFRGFVYGSLRTALHRRLPDLSATNYARRRLCFDLLAAFISALIFGLAHMNLAGLPLYVVSGMVFAEAYRRSGSLYVPMIGHFINNGILMLLMMLVH
jgi:membrane protease YdiL (CAAX protease family)